MLKLEMDRHTKCTEELSEKIMKLTCCELLVKQYNLMFTFLNQCIGPERNEVDNQNGSKLKIQHNEN